MNCRKVLIVAGALLCSTAGAQDQRFENPPQEARPYVWWHWINGNTSKDGIQKDLEWMNRIGIAGFHQFDAGGTMMQGLPPVVPQTPYLSDAWKDNFAYAIHLADSLGMEVGIASAPGWSSTGGPWVEPADAMKKLTWRTLEVKGNGKSQTLTVDMQKPTMTFKIPGRPDYIIPNSNGKGYGRFTLDDNYTSLMSKRLITTRNDLNRYALLQVIHDNYLMGKISPSYFAELFRLMVKERNPQIMSTAIEHMFKILEDVNEDQRAALELCVMDLLNENRTNECHQYVIRRMSTCASSPEVLDQIESIWRNHNDPLLNEHDYMDMAYRLAIMHPQQWQEILSTQRARLTTDDLRNEFDYISRACNPSDTQRLQLFNDLLRPENRQQEPWAITMLQLLNSDVFEPQSNSYIESSLKSLEYIQQTSDIFFPGKWMKALMAGHKSREAVQIIDSFMKANPNYPANLKNKVLEASWILMKQVPYVEPAKPATTKKK